MFVLIHAGCSGLNLSVRSPGEKIQILFRYSELLGHGSSSLMDFQDTLNSFDNNWGIRAGCVLLGMKAIGELGKLFVNYFPRL